MLMIVQAAAEEERHLSSSLFAPYFTHSDKKLNIIITQDQANQITSFYQRQSGYNHVDSAGTTHILRAIGSINGQN